MGNGTRTTALLWAGENSNSKRSPDEGYGRWSLQNCHCFPSWACALFSTVQTLSGINFHDNYFCHLMCSAYKQKPSSPMDSILLSGYPGPALPGRASLRPHLNTKRTATATPTEAPASCPAVKGKTVDKPSCFDFTWLNHKSSTKEATQTRKESLERLPPGMQDAGCWGFPCSWLASILHAQDLKPAPCLAGTTSQLSSLSQGRAHHGTKGVSHHWTASHFA
jgi:hypothetical protein